jgi:DNA processing protein
MRPEMNALEPKVYWIALAAAAGVGPATFRSLLGCFGSPEEVFSAQDEELLACPHVGPATVASIRECGKDLSQFEREISYVHDLGARVITTDDGEYPVRLAGIPNPPPVLWAGGRALELVDAPVAVVGSRRASEEGLEFAWLLARELARAGHTVVSGLAQGIDAAAHSGALYMRHRSPAGSVTVGVLGTGIDVVFPRSTGPIATGVVWHGTLLSEVRPGTGPQPGNFMARDRLISGISCAVVIVEARIGSGTMDTFGHALRQGRPVAAVEWPDANDGTAGNRDALAKGAVPIPADPQAASRALEPLLV